MHSPLNNVRLLTGNFAVEVPIDWWDDRIHCWRKSTKHPHELVQLIGIRSLGQVVFIWMQFIAHAIQFTSKIIVTRHSFCTEFNLEISFSYYQTPIKQIGTIFSKWLPIIIIIIVRMKKTKTKIRRTKNRN